MYTSKILKYLCSITQKTEVKNTFVGTVYICLEVEMLWLAVKMFV